MHKAQMQANHCRSVDLEGGDEAPLRGSQKAGGMAVKASRVEDLGPEKGNGFWKQCRNWEKMEMCGVCDDDILQLAKAGLLKGPAVPCS